MGSTFMPIDHSVMYAPAVQKVLHQGELSQKHNLCLVIRACIVSVLCKDHLMAPSLYRSMSLHPDLLSRAETTQNHFPMPSHRSLAV